MNDLFIMKNGQNKEMAKKRKGRHLSESSSKLSSWQAFFADTNFANPKLFFADPNTILIFHLLAEGRNSPV